MSNSTLRRLSVGWFFLWVWLTGIGCGPGSPPSGTGAAPGAARGSGDAGDAAVDRILVTAGTGGCGGAASCAGQGVSADAGSTGASDGGAPPDASATDPRGSAAAEGGSTGGGSVGSCGTGGHAGAGGRAAAAPAGGAAGSATSASGGTGVGANGGGRGGAAGQVASASGGATGGSGLPMAGSGGIGHAGGAGGGTGEGGSAGRGGSSAGGSPGVAGAAGASGLPPAPGELRIVELLVNPAGTDTGREWIELANTGGHPLDLSGLHVADAANDAAVDFEVLGGAAPVLPAGGRAVLIQSADPAKNGGIQLGAGGPGIIGGAFGTRVSLNNDADTITVCAGPCRAGGVALDEVSWTDLGADYDGHALSIDGTGRRCAAATAFGDAGSFGTPGAANSSCP